MIFFGKPYQMYSRIWPPFCFNIPNPDIQVRQILHPEKTRLKRTLLTVRLSLALKGQAGEGRSSVSILAFTLLLLVSLIDTYFYFPVKTAEDHCCLPNKKLALFLLQGCQHTAIMQTPPKKKKLVSLTLTNHLGTYICHI